MADHPAFPGLPAGMPNPEAIFDSWWPILIALGGGVVYAIRQFFRGARCMSQTKLDDKVAIVTGANAGIGRHIAEDFAKRGAKVYLACRNADSGEKTAKEIRQKAGNENVHSIKCDLMSFKSIQSFVDAFKKKEDTLHFLVNNAGVMMCPQNLTEDKFEEQFQVNYLGHAKLTHLLLGCMKQSEVTRIINTTCPAFQLAEMNLEDVNFSDKEYQPSQAFAQSKLAVVHFTIKLAQELADTNVTVNCAIPGVVRTGIHRHMPFRKSAFISLTFSPFIYFLMKAPEDGAQTSIFLAVAEALQNVSGKCYKECTRFATEKAEEDLELRNKLWDKTLEWLDVKQFGETE